MGRQLSAKKIIFIGFIMVVIGVAIPFAILLSVLPSTFFLAFVAYICSVGGLLTGIIGAAFYHKEEQDDYF